MFGMRKVWHSQEMLYWSEVVAEQTSRKVGYNSLTCDYKVKPT